MEFAEPGRNGPCPRDFLLSDFSLESTPSPSPAASLPTEAALDSSILRVLMDTIPDRIYFKDLQSRFVRVNRAYAVWHGMSPEEILGKTDSDLFAAIHADVAFAEEQEIIRTGVPLVAKVEKLTMKDGSIAWGSATKMAWRDQAGNIIGTFGLTRDATAVKLAEEKLVEERNLLRTIIDHLPARIYVKDTESRYLLNNLAHLAGLGLQRQDEATGHSIVDFFPNERGRQAVLDDQQVLESGQPILNQEKSDFGAGQQLHWSLTTKVPLRDMQGNTIGLVGISHDITRRKQAEGELQRRTLEMETDVLMARQVQETFLPRAFPVFPRGIPTESSALRFAYRYLPATTLGGDFFNVSQLSDTKCGVLVCDVMGHGVRAGLLTALIRGVVGELGERAEDPRHVLAEINHCLAPVLERSGQPVFATAFFGVIDTASSTLTYGNAGHPAPLIRRGASGSVLRLSSTDPEPAAGLIPNFAYTRQECPFNAGDLLLGYTDGLIEAPDASGDFYGDQRLSLFLAQDVALSGEEVCAKLVEELAGYSGRTLFDDDVCIVTIESTGTTCMVQPVSYDI
jgi:sigma-B regulation protein RsbU (phosphoserine phosphatase)